MEFNSRQITEIIKCYQNSKCDWLYGGKADDNAMFALLLTETHGHVCNECGVKDKCTPIHSNRIEAIHNKPAAPRMSYTKTNAQLAEELGISKRQVPKMRKRGEL